MEKHELYHHGVKGMKWGVRRTKRQLGYPISKKIKRKLADIKTKRDEKKRAVESEKVEEKKRNKSIKDMSDDELRDRINRKELEKRALILDKDISDLSPKHVSLGKRLATQLGTSAVTAVSESGKKLMADYLLKFGQKKLGLGDAVDDTKALQKEVENLKLRYNKERYKKQLSEMANDTGNAKSKTANDDVGNTKSKQSNDDASDSKNKTSTSDNAGGNKLNKSDDSPKSDKAPEASTPTVKMVSTLAELSGGSKTANKVTTAALKDDSGWTQLTLDDIPQNTVSKGESFLTKHLTTARLKDNNIEGVQLTLDDFLKD